MKYKKSEAKDHAREHMRGVWAANLTTFDAALKLDEQAMRGNLRHWITTLGLGGLFIAGKQAEYFSMSITERKRLMELSVEEASNAGNRNGLGACGIITSCSDTNLDVVLDLARYSQDIGADYIIVHALVDGDPGKPTLFLVDSEAPGLTVLREPKFTHTYVFSHRELRFEGVEVGADRMLGGVGQGLELTKDWFVEARLQIAANCLGAAIRAFELADDWASRRVQFGVPIRKHQAIEFMLADMAVEIMAAKSMIYRVAWEIDQGIDRKVAHARASVIKLHASEMAGRVLDKAVQIFGGRGYMRENAVERLSRDVRVDRIWEGTSEIQRVIIGGQLGKRGTELFTGWYSPPG